MSQKLLQKPNTCHSFFHWFSPLKAIPWFPPFLSPNSSYICMSWINSPSQHSLSLSLSRISCATYIKMMRKQISYVNLVEVAPAPLISHNKASNAPKLETIVEEGLMEKMDISSKKVLYALPIILSLLSYLLINRLFIIWW